MDYYTKNEKLNFIKWYYAGNSLREVQALFAGLNPNRNVPSKSTVSRIIYHLEKTGSVLRICKCRKQHRRRENDTRDNVVASVIENKNVSLRTIGRRFGIHHTTAHRILRKENFKSYRYGKHQILTEVDKFRRLEFCQTMMEQVNEAGMNFLSRVLFSDEKTFRLKAGPNSQNFRYWSTENQHLYVGAHTQYPESVNVWVGILGHHVIGPFFINRRLTGDVYLNLLRENVIPAIREAGVDIGNIWFQHDGCPAHNSQQVRTYLDETFPNRWIGRGGRIPWAPRSPDLSPNDFFLWGHLTSVLYNEVQFNNAEELRNAISDRCRGLSQYQLARVRREFYDRLGYCSAAEGGIFEHLL